MLPDFPGPLARLEQRRAAAIEQTQTNTEIFVGIRLKYAAENLLELMSKTQWEEASIGREDAGSGRCEVKIWKKVENMSLNSATKWCKAGRDTHSYTEKSECNNVKSRANAEDVNMARDSVVKTCGTNGKWAAVSQQCSHQTRW